MSRVRRVGGRPPALPDMSDRIVATFPDPQRAGYVVTQDEGGVCRTGPAGAWWSTLKPHVRNGIGITLEAPLWRVRAWNVAAVVYAVAAVVLATRMGMLVPFLVILGGLVVVAAVGLWWIHKTLPARSAREIARPFTRENNRWLRAAGPTRPVPPAPAPARTTDVHATPVAEGVH